MRVVNVSDLDQGVTELVTYAKQARETVLVCVRSAPAAYIVDAETFDRLRRELVRLRHELLWRGVSEAEADYRDGRAKDYTDIDTLIADLGLRGNE
jgi:PHD/YefM family antitoxin component YafN of YafNO toxin-antitoxin module